MLPFLHLKSFKLIDKNRESLSTQTLYRTSGFVACMCKKAPLLSSRAWILHAYRRVSLIYLFNVFRAHLSPTLWASEAANKISQYRIASYDDKNKHKIKLQHI